MTDSCGPGRAIRKVNADGTVICEVTAGSALYQPPMKPWVLDLAGLGSGYCCYGGGFTDGPNAYLVPLADGAGGYSGRVLRVGIDKFSLAETASVDVYSVDASARGFYGGFTDGRYGYLAPYANSASNKHGRIARIDLQNFTTGGVTILNLQSIDAALAGYHGAFTDGRYGYFVPLQNNIGPFGKVARVDLSNFTAGGVTVLDLATVDPDLVYFTSGFTDGKYAYFISRSFTHGKVARVELSNFNAGGVTVLNLSAISAGLGASAGGAFTDGRYGYFPMLDAPGSVYSGKVVRVNLSNFTPDGVTVLDLAAIDPAVTGFQGGFTDGRYAWIAPGIVGSKGARIDLANFSASGISVSNFPAIDPAGTWPSGFTNGRHRIFVPYSGSKLMRVQMFQGPGSL